MAGAGDEDYWLTLSAEDESGTGDLYDYPPVPFCPIRFQGQWEDAETGLFQNRFRSFDSGTGAYIQPDLARLGGGFSLHGYVEFPTSFVDPLGLRGVNVRQGGPNGFHLQRQLGIFRMP